MYVPLKISYFIVKEKQKEKLFFEILQFSLKTALVWYIYASIFPKHACVF